MFYYSAFGLKIASEIHFPELLQVGEYIDPDVNIFLGTTPESLPGAKYYGDNLSISPDAFLYHIEDVANYYAENGSSIIVEPYTSSNEKDIRIYLLCNAMAAIIYQRGLIPLHASGVITNEGVTLIIGPSGAGKSTTIKALTKRGHRIFTDDVCIVKIINETVHGIPSYPMMKLWENSFRLLNLGNTKEEDKIWQHSNKYSSFFHNTFITEWKPICRIIMLEGSENEKNVKLIEQNNLEAFKAIGANAYRAEYIEPMNLNALHFTMVNRLVKQCEVYKITRPEEGVSIDGVVELIEMKLL